MKALTFSGKALLVAMAFAGVQDAAAQTLNAEVGQVTYQIDAASAGRVTFTDGTILTLADKAYAISDVNRLYTSTDAACGIDTVYVTYSDSEATVVAHAAMAPYLSITASDGDVTIDQSDDLATEITYVLTGTSSDGSFTMDGSLKATVVLNDLTLTKSTQAPINIENGKRINIVIEGTNTLKDSSSSSGKGVLMVNGHSEITGSGTLNLYGYAKHAYWADEYVQIKKSFTGSVNVLKSVKDGFNINQYFEMNGGTVSVESGIGDDGIAVAADDAETGYVLIQGGTLNISTSAASAKGLKADGDITINEDKGTTVITIKNTGAAAYDSDDAEVKGTACISSDANVTIDAGTITLTATGKGGKGLKCDSTFTMNDGTLTATTSGTEYTYSNDSSSPKPIKVGSKTGSGNSYTYVGHVQINGGTITVEASGQSDSSEGIESKNTLNIAGGTVTVIAYDDAINSARDMVVSGGTVVAISENNDGLDSNADLYISGGTVMAFGGEEPECSIDAAEGYNLYFNGGLILGVGASSISPSSSSAQAWVSTTSSVSGGQTISVTSGTTTIATFTVPSEYTGTTSTGNTSGPGSMGGGFGNMGGGSMGGSSSGSQVIVSAPDLTSGSSYTLTIGSTSTTVTATKSSSGGSMRGW